MTVGEICNCPGPNNVHIQFGGFAAPIVSEAISNGRILMMIPDKTGVELVIEYFKN